MDLCSPPKKHISTICEYTFTHLFNRVAKAAYKEFRHCIAIHVADIFGYLWNFVPGSAVVQRQEGPLCVCLGIPAPLGAQPPKQRAAGGVFGGLMDGHFHFFNVAGRYAAKTLIDIHTININTMIHMYNSMHIIIRYYLVTNYIFYLVPMQKYEIYVIFTVFGHYWEQKHPETSAVRDRHLRHHPEKLMYITGCAGSFLKDF